MDNWLATELLTGFQKLLCLGLDRTPATDLLPGTVMAWQEAVTTGRAWDQQRDATRIRAAFVTLAQTRESWPQPRHFLDALPRVEQAAIGYEVKPASKEEAAAAMAKIRGLLKEPMPTFRPDPPPVSPYQLNEVEADLRKHYGKDAAAEQGQ